MTPAPYHAELADGPKDASAYWVETSDNVRIRVGVFPAIDPRGTVVLMPGRTEYIEKYGRTAADLTARGYSVIVIDWRGQGLADRLLDDDRIGHIGVFAEYQRDLDAALDAARALDLPEPFHLLAHSMGGCIGLRALVRGLPFASAVFSGPMWGIRIATFMRPVAWSLSWGVTKTGMGHLMTPGTKADSYILSEPFETNQLTRDQDSWELMRSQLEAVEAFRLGGPSMQWLNAALQECRVLSALPAPDVPCLTFVGGNERIVDVDRIKDRMDRWPSSTFKIIPCGEHEMLMDRPELRRQLADTIETHMDAAVVGPKLASALR